MKLEITVPVVWKDMSLWVLAVSIVLAFPGVTGGRCFDHKDCHTCTLHKTWSRGPCYWCPLDNACHAKWSPKNDCLKSQNIRRHSLCPRKTVHRETYNPHKAYKLAQFSAMAYSDTPEKCLAAMLPDGNFTDAFVNRQPCDNFLFDYSKQCLAFIVADHDDAQIVVSFRGTRGTKQIFDQALTLLGTPSIHSGVGGKVQRYFQNVFDSLYSGVRYNLKPLIRKYPTYKVVFTGHSLGGATASITSATLVKENILTRDNTLLYTYGMPRVGNKIYAEAHDNLVPQSWRVVREGDIVTRFPPCRFTICSRFNGPYHHKKKVLYKGFKMTKNSPYYVCNGNEDSNGRCTSTGRQKRGILPSLSVHKNYFGIRIGTHCVDEVLS